MANRSVQIKVGAATVGVLAAASVLPLGGAASGGTSKQCPALPQGADPVHLHPADFSANINNPHWPMTVGSRWVYRVTRLLRRVGEPRRDQGDRRTKLIADGIKARVIRDVVSHHGKPVEKTRDWYAQDNCGNVWYFGEHTIEYPRPAARQRHLAGGRRRGTCPGSRCRPSPRSA